MIIGQWVNGRSAPGSGAMPLTAPQPATAPQLIQRTGQNWTFSSYISFLSSCSDIKQLDVVVFYFPSCNVLTSLLHAGFVFRWEVSVVFLLTYFGHWDISVICLTAVLKLAVTVLINLYFQVFWPKKKTGCTSCFLLPLRYNGWSSRRKSSQGLGLFDRKQSSPLSPASTLFLPLTVRPIPSDDCRRHAAALHRSSSRLRSADEAAKQHHRWNGGNEARSPVRQLHSGVVGYIRALNCWSVFEQVRSGHHGSRENKGKWLDVCR